MRIGRLFTASMLSVTALAVVLGAEVLVPQYRTVMSKAEALRAVDAFGAVLVVSQHIASHRAPLLGPLYQEEPAKPVQLDAIKKATEASDVAFENARRAVSALGDGASMIQVLNQVASNLADIRSSADRAMTVPMSGRDSAVVKGVLPGLTKAAAAIEPLLNRLENETAAADASLTALLGIARTAQDMRLTAGSRAAILAQPMTGRRPPTPAEVSSLDRAQGRLEVERERIEAGVDQIGRPGKLVGALREAIQGYFMELAPKIEQDMSSARTDGRYKMSSEDLTSMSIASVQRFIVVRDAALSESAERARVAHDQALTMLALAGVAVLALLGVLAGVTILLRRRVVAPLTELTVAISELAAGRQEVTIPAIDRADEIGTMAKSLQVFKEAIVAKTAADKAASAETDAKVQRGQRVDRITSDFETMIGGIVEIVSSASSALEASADTLTSTAACSEQLTEMVAEASGAASANVQSVACATEEMASSVNEISRQVRDSARIANEAVAQAQDTNGRVAELAKAATRIGDVVELINTIAGQTNLLALNATIEAARAGEAGRGFAVVATEVKALAEQTSKATGEISQQIHGIQSATQESVDAIREIGNTIGRISEIASAIAAAVEEQGAATQEIARNVQRAAQGTQQVSSIIADVQRGASKTGSESSQVHSAAKSLSSESDRLKQEVGKFLTAVRAA